MARTRGIAPSAEYSGDGVILDKDGKPIAVTPKAVVPLHPHGEPVEGVDLPWSTEPEEAPPPPPARFVCNPSTLERSLEAIDLARLLVIAYGDWKIEVSEEELSRMPPDVKRYFRRVA